MSDRNTDDKGYLLAPIQLPQHSDGKDAWFYEEPNGLEIHMEHPAQPHATIRIPWRLILEAAKRHAKRKESPR